MRSGGACIGEWVEAPSDGAGDEGGAFLLKQLDQPLLPRHQRIDLCCFTVEEVNDGLLFRMRRQGYDKTPPLIHTDGPSAMSGLSYHRNDDSTGESIQRPREVEGVDTVDQPQRFHVLIDGYRSCRHRYWKTVCQYHPPHDHKNDLRCDELEARFVQGLLCDQILGGRDYPPLHVLRCYPGDFPIPIRWIFFRRGGASRRAAQTPESCRFPMRRDLAQPLDAGVPVLGVRPKAPMSRLLAPIGYFSHRSRLPSALESPAATARRRATPA